MVTFSKLFLLALVLAAYVYAGPAAAQDCLSQELTLAEQKAVLRNNDDGDKGAGQESAPQHQSWLFHAQVTEIGQGQPGFHSPYRGENSLPPDDDFRQTSSMDIYLGAHTWPGGEIYLNAEYYQGFGLGRTHGIAAFPNAEAYKVGQKIGDVFVPHFFLRQTFGLGGEKEETPGDLLQLAEKQDVSRIIFMIGRLSVGDQFDGNAYAHDQRKQFINWVLVDSAAFDYAADSLGYIEGATLELNQKDWAIRYGIFDVPRVSNGFAKDQHFDKAWQQVIELEERFSVFDHPGKVRFLGWLEHAHMGSYRETLAHPEFMGDITLTRRYRYQYGVALSVEQEIIKDIGAFVRASWRDGESEVWQFTDVDRNVSVGVQVKGSFWNRGNDTFGIAEFLSGISSAHRRYLAAGGLGPLLGDGKLPHYALESVIEAYYDAEIIKHVHLAVDYQLAVNPAYNQDRGPINIFSGRMHVEF
ncbi:MAG: carbohydrate porin [Verrucomicrobiota bacterium]|nr:carbohydrate porin [Verrucomicrobiota bacterium]